jgi:hypothetical protein
MDDRETGTELPAEGSAGSWEVVAEFAGEFIPEALGSEGFAGWFCFVLAIPLIWFLVLMIQSIIEDLTGGPPQSLFS